MVSRRPASSARREASGKDPRTQGIHRRNCRGLTSPLRLLRSKEKRTPHLQAFMWPPSQHIGQVQCGPVPLRRSQWSYVGEFRFSSVRDCSTLAAFSDRVTVWRRAMDDAGTPSLINCLRSQFEFAIAITLSKSRIATFITRALSLTVRRRLQEYSPGRAGRHAKVLGLGPTRPASPLSTVSIVAVSAGVSAKSKMSKFSAIRSLLYRLRKDDVSLLVLPAKGC